MTEPEQWAVELANELAVLARKCRCKKCMAHDAKVIVRAVKRRDQALRTGQLIPAPSVDDAMVERLPKEAAMLREIAQSYSRGIEWQANLSASAEVIDAATARITALEASLAEAEGRVIAEVVVWLRKEAGDPDDFATYAATALETGRWKK